ncbi:hypothetical protein GCM10007382_13260 [Salinibacterium xinjiangense]|nr:hypothetical protein GCM10007382_13260 [Salinibacterium xinjiangense]
MKLDLVAGFGELLEGELGFLALDLLHPKNVYVFTQHPIDDPADSASDRIHIPGGNSHAPTVARCADERRATRVRTTPVSPPNWAATALCARQYCGQVPKLDDLQDDDAQEDDSQEDDATTATPVETRRAVIITVVALLAIVVSSLLFVFADGAG